MICPKCSREMGNDADICPYCGFTFLTPKDSGEIHSIPYYSVNTNTHAAQRSPVPAPVRTVPRVPEYTSGVQSSPAEPLSTLRYIGLLLLGLIPVIGYIVYIVLAARKDGDPNQKHFAAAMLIVKTIGLLFILGAVIVYIVYTTPLFFYFFR